MDAAQTNFKKIVFFLATALLLMAALPVSAQTLQASATTVTIGNTYCNESQTVSLVSNPAGTSIGYTVNVTYTNGNAFGNWLYVMSGDGATTTNGTTISDLTGLSGNTLTIGLATTALGSQAASATVTVTPTNPANGSAITIQVNYQESTSCGGNTGSTNNGVISVTPGSISLSGSQLTQQLGIQNLINSGLTFSASWSVNSGGNWLSVTSTSTSISSGSTTNVSVVATPSNATSTGALTGTVIIQALLNNTNDGVPIQIPVTFTTSGSTIGGSSGTLTLNGATSNVYNTSLIYSGSSSGVCVPIQDTASGANAYAYTVTTTTGGNWLLANNQLSGVAQGLLAPGSNECVGLTLSNVTASLASGYYQGSVALTSSSGSSATINVNLYVSQGSAAGVSVSPSLVYVFNNVALNSNVTQQQTFTLTGTGTNLAAATALSPGSWFSMSTPVVSGGLESFTVTANSSGLSANIYSTVITVQSTGTGSVQSGTTYITVILPVGQPGPTQNGGSPTTASAVQPLSLAFQQQQGNSFFTSSQEQQDITISGQQGSQWSASVSYGTGAANWLNFDSPATGSGTFGSTPATLAVDLGSAVSSVTPSSTPYTATIQITAGGNTFTVPVTLLVTPATEPVLLAKPASATFSTINGSAPASQTIVIVGSDNTGSNLSPQIVAGAPTQTWITATASGNNLTINVNPNGLSSGVYSGTIPVNAVNSTAYPTTINFPVVLIVGSGTSTGPLTLNPSAITFTNVTGTASQNLVVTASSATNFSVTAGETSCQSSSWLTVGTGNFDTANATVSVTVNPSGISTGTVCAGIITLVSSTATQTVNVSMTVGGATATGQVSLSTSSMSFTYTQGQSSAPSSQSVSITSATTGTAAIPFTVTTTPASSWLQVNNTSASTPYTLQVSVSPGSLPPSTYYGTVTISPNGGIAQSINVTFTVTATAVVTASPTSLSLSYNVGGTSPTGTIQVSANGAAAGFTATASSSQGWLQVSPTSGTTPNTGTTPLTVSVVSSVLSTLLPSATPYTGTITISGASPATGTTLVQVSLTITQPLPVITNVTNAASGASGAISPGEIIAIYGTNIGPTTPAQLNSTTCPSPCTQIPTTMGNVTVTFLPSGLKAPLIYVSAGQINTVVPYGVAGLASLSMEVSYLGQTSQAQNVTLAATAPGIFTQSGLGTGLAAANEYSPQGAYQGENSLANQVAPGGVLVIYVTGEGVVTPTPVSGTVIQPTNTNPPTPVPGYAPTVLIGNQPATVQYYGETAGVVAGLLQINVLVPLNVPAGPQTLSVSIGPNSSQAGVTVAVQ